MNVTCSGIIIAPSTTMNRKCLPLYVYLFENAYAAMMPRISSLAICIAVTTAVLIIYLKNGTLSMT